MASEKNSDERRPAPWSLANNQTVNKLMKYTGYYCGHYSDPEAIKRKQFTQTELSFRSKLCGYLDKRHITEFSNKSSFTDEDIGSFANMISSALYKVDRSLVDSLLSDETPPKKREYFSDFVELIAKWRLKDPKLLKSSMRTKTAKSGLQSDIQNLLLTQNQLLAQSLLKTGSLSHTGDGETAVETPANAQPSTSSSSGECKPPLPVSNTRFSDIAGQVSAKEDLRMNYIYPLMYKGLFKEKTSGLLLYGPPGTGKCLGPDVGIIMYDGKIKKARDVRPGDALMGDDSEPRYVHTVCTDTDSLYNVIPLDGYGKPYVANKAHILSLLSPAKPKLTKLKKDGKTIGYQVCWYENQQLNAKIFKGNASDQSIRELAEYFCYTKNECYTIQDIEIGSYEILTREQRENYYEYRVSTDFPHIETTQDPFVMGQTVHIMTDDEKIPHEYIANNKSYRMEFLRGVLYDKYSAKLQRGSYSISHKNNAILEQLAFLGRSLGLNVSEPSKSKIKMFCTGLCPTLMKYEPCQTSSEVSSVPLFAESSFPNIFKFQLEYIGIGRYYGFCIGGNRRFLLEDFTVTHNTMLARAATASIPNTAFFAPTPGEIKGKYEGETEKSIQNIFSCAGSIVTQNEMPVDPSNPEQKVFVKSSVVFIDEADSLLGERTSESSARTTNAFLQAMDGIQKNDNVSVIAATNYPWRIDEAVLRRFSSQIFIDKPDLVAIKWLIEYSLVKLYSFPWENLTVKDVGVIYQRIKLYSDQHCNASGSVESGGGWGVFTNKTHYNYVTSEFVDYIASRMNHSSKLDDVIRQITIEKKHVNFQELVPVEDYFCGFSGSDITKIMSLSARRSATESLNGVFYEQTYKSGNISKKYYVHIGESQYKSLMNKPTKMYTLNSHARDLNAGWLGSVRVDLIPAHEHDICFNLSICPIHIAESLKSFNSSVKLKKYIDLLLYKSLGVIPSSSE